MVDEARLQMLMPKHYQSKSLPGPLAGLAILPGPGFPTPGKPGLANNAF